MKSALLFESGISTQNLFQLFHWPSGQVWSCLGLWLESFQALHLLIQPLTDWSLKIKPMKLFVFPIRKFGVPQVPTESLPYAAQALGKRHISGDLGRCQRKTCWSISLCYWVIEIQMRVPKWSINFMFLYVYIYIHMYISTVTPSSCTQISLVELWHTKCYPFSQSEKKSNTPVWGNKIIPFLSISW